MRANQTNRKADSGMFTTIDTFSRVINITLNQGWQYGTVRSTIWYASIFDKKYGTFVRYALFVKVTGTVGLYAV